MTDCEWLRRGEIVLAYGYHELFVPLAFHPRWVAVNCRSEGIPVCVAGPSTEVSFGIREGGIAITANVTCNYEVIEWLAK